MIQQVCLFCGADASAVDHLASCDGRQGRQDAPGTAILGTTYRAPFAAGRETSEAAARAIEPSAESLCAHVLRAIRARGGLTCDEIETTLRLPHQTASARVWDLHRRDWIRDSGTRRPTASGRRAIVWVAA